MKAMVLVLGLVAVSAAAEFRWAPVGETSLGLWDGERPVWVYHHGEVRAPGVPEDRARSSYLHPLYGLDGEVLTDDFPADHLHHRGLFWAWPHVGIEGREYDLWMLRGIRHRFERWIRREADAASARLELENGWYVGDDRVMVERVELVAHAIEGDARAIDVSLTWTAVDTPVRLAGAAGKSYGGLTLRYAPGTATVITTPSGQGGEDLYMTRLPWADLTRRFRTAAGAEVTSGAAIFIGREHPDYPPTWLTRHYGVLCLGWPGVEGGTLAPGVPVRCRYRVWIHRGGVTPEQVARAYDAYVGDPGSTAAAGPRLRAVVKDGDRVEVWEGDTLFTEYRYGPDTKYPFFHPLRGPRTGRSVTAYQTEPYPHHSSLFFGCDRVNGGNYWQEGLDRGRIASQSVKVSETPDGAVVVDQECRWERPGAAAPFTDRRRIRIWAPTAGRRCLEWDMTLTAATDVRIERSNHALFSARLAPDLAVTGGGRLVNSSGLSGEKATFGQPARWMDGRGDRGGAVEGLAIFCHPRNPWQPSFWFTRDYGFFSPTPMYWLKDGVFEMAKGETLRLRYLVLVHADNPSDAVLEDVYAGAWAADR